MAKLPSPVLKEFLKGNHVMRHRQGIWNGTWSDMFIESTFMRYGHGPGGIIGIKLSPNTLKRWALSLHICSTVKQNLIAAVNGEDLKVITKHKEEGQTRILTDATDRKKIREKLLTCIDPFDPSNPDMGIVNIVSGRVAELSVNVEQSAKLGSTMMSEFLKSWPEGFNKTISTPIVTMSMGKKHVKVDKVPVYDPSVIYLRILGLQKARDINLKEVMKYELAAIPPSIFDEKTGEMRLIQSKSCLKSQLQVEIPWTSSYNYDVTLLDGCAFLWIVSWPAKGTVRDYIKNSCLLFSHI